MRPVQADRSSVVLYPSRQDESAAKSGDLSVIATLMFAPLLRSSRHSGRASTVEEKVPLLISTLCASTYCLSRLACPPSAAVSSELSALLSRPADSASPDSIAAASPPAFSMPDCALMAPQTPAMSSPAAMILILFMFVSVFFVCFLK